MSEAAVLTIDQVSLSAGGRVILDGLALNAQRRQITALLGPNGAGKTTAIRCCIGLIAPESGRITVLGHQPGSPEAAHAIGFMPQSTGAWSGVTPRRLLHYLAALYSNGHSVADVSTHLGLGAFLDTPYRRLSGGQQQLVNLAGALIGRPELVFLDEPTAGLDPHVRRDVWELLAELPRAGVSVLLTTHDMHEAAALADRLWIMDRGRITISGSVADLTASGSLEETFLANTSRGER